MEKEKDPIQVLESLVSSLNKKSDEENKLLAWLEAAIEEAELNGDTPAKIPLMNLYADVVGARLSEKAKVLQQFAAFLQKAPNRKEVTIAETALPPGASDEMSNGDGSPSGSAR